jgi:hypothetical protein
VVAEDAYWAYARLNGELAAARAELEAIRASSSWRAMSVFQRYLEPHLKMRKILRRVVRTFAGS